MEIHALLVSHQRAPCLHEGVGIVRGQGAYDDCNVGHLDQLFEKVVFR